MSELKYVFFFLKQHPFIDFLVSPEPIGNTEEYYQHKQDIKFLYSITAVQPVLYYHNNVVPYYLIVITDEQYFGYYLIKKWVDKQRQRIKYQPIGKLIQYNGKTVQ